MAKKIICTFKAKTELINVLEYWNNRNKSKTFSLKLNNLVKVQLNLIAEYPNISRKTDIQNVLVKVIQKIFCITKLLMKTYTF